MSTRGTYGFIKDNITYLFYNHYDSYPSGFGEDVASFIERNTTESLNKILDKVIEGDYSELSNHFDIAIEETNDFIKNSLFCEYGYIINLDTNKLMVFKGFNKDKKDQYDLFKIITSRNGYYSCSLIRKIDLEKIQDEWNSFVEEEDIIK